MTCTKILLLAALLVSLLLLVVPSQGAADYGKHDKAMGTACIVKGSYCNCHYCKCEKGHVHCGYEKGYGEQRLQHFKRVHGQFRRAGEAPADLHVPRTVCIMKIYGGCSRTGWIRSSVTLVGLCKS